MGATQCRLASDDGALARETAHGSLNHCDRVTKGSTGTGSEWLGIRALAYQAPRLQVFSGGRS